jgi:hypothetical protein
MRAPLPRIPAVRIDHVLLATADIAATADRLLAQYGLASVPGGAHPQWGTANRIVALGGPYLEIIGVTDPAVAEANPLGRWIRGQTAAGDVLAAVMVEPDDFTGVCARLSLTPTPGQRARPDGSTASWQLAGMAEALTRAVPCFIRWDSRDDLFDGDGGVGATGIRELELGGDPAAIAEWLGGDVDGLRLVGGPPGIRRLAIDTRAGELVLPEHPGSE